MPRFIYIIEHMEEDDEKSHVIPPWVKLEYAHMRTLAGPEAKVHFSHLSKASCDFIAQSFVPGNGLAQAACHIAGVLELIKNGLGQEVSLNEVCLLDPRAPKELAPEDGDGKFKCFLFGGILGDDPPRDRTSELRALGFPSRHLGPVQMTTDTALGVTKLVIHDHIRLDDIPYTDYPTIVFNPRESVEMPFRYIMKDGVAVLPPGMRELLHDDLNKSFDF